MAKQSLAQVLARILHGAKKEFSRLQPGLATIFNSRSIVVMLLIVIAFQWDANRQLTSQVTLANVAVAPVPTAVPQPTPSVFDSTGKLTPVVEADHIEGPKNAKVTLIEYTDLECPYCRTFHATLQKARQEYGDQIAWVYRPFPLTIHEGAQKKAESVECVAELGGNDKVWKYIDTLFTAKSLTPLTQLSDVAGGLGIDTKKFESCLDSGKYADKVAEGIKTGELAKVTGTPGTVLVRPDGSFVRISGAQPYTVIKAQIDQALALAK